MRQLVRDSSFDQEIAFCLEQKMEREKELHGCALVFEMHHPYEMGLRVTPFSSLLSFPSPSSAPSNSCIGDVTPGSLRSAGKIN